jgi:ribosomal protein S18 acetylase RimI-like enzyme
MYARYLDEVAGGFFRFMLGRRVADIIATAYIQPNNDFSHQNVTFAECDGLIVGVVSGYAAEEHRRFSGLPLKHAAGNRALRMRGVRILCAPLLRFLGTHAEDDFYLQAMIVDEGHRGEGIGSTLLDCIEDRARGAGSARLSLDVSANNEGARRLYERRGMTVESGWPRLFFIPRLVVRMTKSL